MFHGWGDVVRGVAELAPYAERTLGGDPLSFPQTVTAAVGELRNNGIGGPYGLALDPSITPWRRRPPSTAVRCSSITFGRFSKGRSCGLPASAAAW